MPLYVFFTMVQKSKKWPKSQIKGSCLNRKAETDSSFTSLTSILAITVYYLKWYKKLKMATNASSALIKRYVFLMTTAIHFFSDEGRTWLMHLCISTDPSGSTALYFGLDLSFQPIWAPT